MREIGGRVLVGGCVAPGCWDMLNDYNIVDCEGSIVGANVEVYP